MDALKSMDVDVIISCGDAINREELGELPDNIQVFPMVLYPQTGEQYAVARRVTEIGAGIMLKNDSTESLRAAVQEILDNKVYGNAAKECSVDFRACPGTAGAAEFTKKKIYLPDAPQGAGLMEMLFHLTRVCHYLTIGI